MQWGNTSSFRGFPSIFSKSSFHPPGLSLRDLLKLPRSKTNNVIGWHPCLFLCFNHHRFHIISKLSFHYTASYCRGCYELVGPSRCETNLFSCHFDLLAFLVTVWNSQSFSRTKRWKDTDSRPNLTTFNFSMICSNFIGRFKIPVKLIPVTHQC